MIERLLQKINVLTGLAAVGFFFSLTGLLTNIEIKDLDLWLHVAMGQYITAAGTVPAVDVISCSVAGTPWINHEWLFQIIAHWAHAWAGLDGLLRMQMIVVFMTLTLLLFLIYKREKIWLAILPLYWLFYVYVDRFTVRPDLFSLLFLVCYFFILFRFISARWAVAAVFVLQVLWTNIHGFFIWGPLLVGIVWAGETIKRRWKLPFKSEEYGQLKFLFGAAVVASLINPYGFKGLFYPLSIFFNFFGESQIFFSKILELQKPITWGTLFSFESYAFYKILIFASAISFLLNRRKINLTYLLVWAALLAFSTTAIRNMIYFAFFAVFVIVENCASLSWKDIIPRAAFPAWFKLALAIFVQLAVGVQLLEYGERVSWNGYFDFDTYERKSEFGGFSLRNFPYAAADFLVENDVKGNFFNDFNSGAYLVGRTFPNIRVTIDGRTEVYGADFFQRHGLAWRGHEQTFVEMSEQYQWTGAFLNSVNAPIPKRLVSFLYQQKDWVLVYFDYDALIFLRDVPENRDLIAKYRVNPARLSPLVNDLERIRLRPVEPYRNINRAHSFFSMGFYDQALAEAYEALRVKPDYMEAHKIIGQLLDKKGNHEKAFEHLRAAKVMAPRNLELRYHLALNYEARGKMEPALTQTEIVLNSEPSNDYALVLLARIYAKTKEYSAVERMLPALGQITPTHVGELSAVADILIADGEIRLAQRILEKSLAISPDNVKLKEKLETLKRL